MKLLAAYLTGALGGFLAGVAGLVFVAQNMDIRNRRRLARAGDAMAARVGVA